MVGIKCRLTFKYCSVPGIKPDFTPCQEPLHGEGKRHNPGDDKWLYGYHDTKGGTGFTRFDLSLSTGVSVNQHIRYDG